MLKLPKFITRNILILSGVSFFTDVASEMLYPVMPIYMSSIGFSAITIGIIEGIAEATAGINKVFFGHLSDKSGKRNLFIKIGYGISAFSKPLIGLSISDIFILFIRFLDRIGKGIRTSPRDALLTTESKENYRGRVFGFHRSMDTFGAMLGPILALAFLYFNPLNYQRLFLIALIPGIVAFTGTFLLRKEKAKSKEVGKTVTIVGFVDFWKKSSPFYKKLILGFLLLSLINSSNAFLLLRAKELQFTDTLIIGSYIIYNFIFMLLSYPLGVLSDRFGFKPVFIVGILVFSLVYSILGNGINSPWLLLAVFGIYGIFGAVEEGMSKAWLSLHVPQEYKATGLGLHLTLSSFGFMAASFLTGVIWQTWGAGTAFSIISISAIFIVFYFLNIKK